MSINIAKASEGEFYPFQFHIDVEDDVLSGYEARFDGNVLVSGTYVVNSSNVYIDSTLTYSIIFACDRCLSEVKKDFVTKCTASFYLLGETASEGWYPYTNNLVDMTEPIRQEIILNLPSRVLCKPDCKGLCSNCGTNLNETTCDCDKLQFSENITPDNPFEVLKNLKKSTGGANNGSSKG